MIEFTERKCKTCFHRPCTRKECSPENKEVCEAYETEVSRTIKNLKTDGYEDWEGMR